MLRYNSARSPKILGPNKILFYSDSQKVSELFLSACAGKRLLNLYSLGTQFITTGLLYSPGLGLKMYAYLKSQFLSSQASFIFSLRPLLSTQISDGVEWQYIINKQYGVDERALSIVLHT